MSPCSVGLQRVESKYGHLCCFVIQKYQNSVSVQPLEMHSQRKKFSWQICCPVAPFQFFKVYYEVLPFLILGSGVVRGGGGGKEGRRKGGGREKERKRETASFD